jgi:hypothetical protein
MISEGKLMGYWQIVQIKDQERFENGIRIAREKEAALRRANGEYVYAYDIELEELFEEYMADDSR